MTAFERPATSSKSHGSFNGLPSLEHRPFSDPSRLAPEDAFFAHSPARRQHDRNVNSAGDGNSSYVDSAGHRIGGAARRRREKERERSGSRRRKVVWKKLLWVKQHGCT